MNCPYCDESIPMMAKFCPKCGLPLKEDATLMGGFTDENGGPKKWVLAGGAAAIVVVALGIGLMTSNSSRRPTQVVRRERVGTYSVPALRTGGFTPVPVSRPAASYPGAAARPYAPARSFSSFSGLRPAASGPTRWAFDASRAPKPAPKVVEPEPEVPGHALAGVRALPKAPNYISAIRRDEPAIPEAPPLPSAPLRPSSVTAIPSLTPMIPMAPGAPDPILGLSGNTPAVNTTSDPNSPYFPVGGAPPQDYNGYVYDPVQGRYARPGDQAPRDVDVNSTFAGRRRPNGR